MFQAIWNWIVSLFSKPVDHIEPLPPPPAKPMPQPVEPEAQASAARGPIKGIDISHWQGVVDFEKLKADGNMFVIAKATDGTSYVDATFARNKAGAKKAGLLFGAYHWLKISQDIEAQVKHFINVAGPFAPGEMPPTVDWEPDSDTKSVGVAQTKARVRQFLDRIKELTGVDAMIYGSPGFFDGYGDLSAFASNPLWIAHYGVGYPRIPKAWANYTIWQYTDKNGMDLNLFNGSIDRLNELARVS